MRSSLLPFDIRPNDLLGREFPRQDTLRQFLDTINLGDILRLGILQSTSFVNLMHSRLSMVYIVNQIQSEELVSSRSFLSDDLLP